MPVMTAPLATILVADDSGSAREMLEQMLRTHGYRVLAATNGDEAVSILEGQTVDLALIDVLMPGQNGFAICRRFKARAETRLTPVVLITGLGRVEDRIRGLEAGADDFLCKPVRQEELLARVRSLVRLKQFTDEMESAETVLFALARSIEAKDAYTEGHGDRLSRYSVALAERLGLSDEEQLALRRGGVLHDVGKVAVPEWVLLKPGPLNAAERKLMEAHPITGERICAPLKSFRSVLPIIRWHHERQNGTGYPDHLRGSEIPTTTRILQIADIYDSLTTDRPYRRAMTSAHAFTVMHEEVRRGWWDGALVDEFEDLLHGIVTNASREPFAEPRKAELAKALEDDSPRRVRIA